MINFGLKSKRKGFFYYQVVNHHEAQAILGDFKNEKSSFDRRWVVQGSDTSGEETRIQAGGSWVVPATVWLFSKAKQFSDSSAT